LGCELYAAHGPSQRLKTLINVPSNYLICIKINIKYVHNSYFLGKQLAKCLLCSKILSNTSKSRLLMHRNTCNTSKLYKTGTTGINKSTPTQNNHNAEPPVLEVMGTASSPISPIASSSTSETQGKRKHVNIFESDSDPDDPFYNSNSSITMPNLSLNTSTVCSTLTLETENAILLASSSSEKQLQMSDYIDSFTSTNSNTFVTVKNKNKQQGTIQRYHDTITNAEIDLVNFKLGKMFFGCNIPFSVVESVHFK